MTNRVFALTLLYSSFAALFASLVIFNGTTILSQTNPFQSADIFKVSLFVKGISPYSSEPWAAPYPPFYFALWALPYLFLSAIVHLSSSGIFTGFRVISALAFCVCAYLIYGSQKVVARMQGKLSESKAISMASLFVLCSLVAVVYPVGDALGILLLSGACVAFTLRNSNSTWLGVLLVSLAVAFKVQPILGALLLLAYYYYRSKASGIARHFLNPLVSFVGVMAGLVVIPMVILPDALNSFLLYNAQNIQHYTFNVYAALYDLALDLIPSSSSYSSLALDALWLCLSALLVVYLARTLFSAKSFLLTNKDSMQFYALDVLSLGILAWLLVLKQTMPHYFLWAIVPLMARGRTRSLYYVLAGELFGMVFFALAQAFTTNFFTLTGALATVPGLGVSLLLLAGGILFDVFIVLAMKELVAEMKLEAKSDNTIAQGIEIRDSLSKKSSALN